MTTTLALDTDKLQKLSKLPTELALQQAAPFLAHLVKDPTFLEAEILPLLGSLLLCCGIRTRRALRAPGRRLPARLCRPEKDLTTLMEQGRRSVERPPS